MSKLIESMKVLLADTFAFRLKTQFYHWNISGPNFIEYHRFLGDLYEEADSSIDTIAEHIRSLGAFAPGSFKRYLELSTIKDEDTIPEAIVMLRKLSDDNKLLHTSLTVAHTAAEQEKQLGILNFLEGLIDANEKTQWLLNSIIK